jgi:hypothetical protein
VAERSQSDHSLNGTMPLITREGASMKKLFETASNGEQVDKLAKAARALGLSEQTVESKHGQRQSITKMQIQTMDHMMDAREEQIKLPNPKTVSPSALLSKLKSYCRSLARLAVGQMARPFQMAATSILQFWTHSRSRGGRCGHTQ